MKKLKVVVIFYILAISIPIIWPKIMPTNCAKHTCNYVEITPQEPGTILFIETSTFYNHVLIYGEEDVVVESVQPFSTVTIKKIYDNGLKLPGTKAYALELKESENYDKEIVMQEAANFAMEHTESYYDINFLNNKNGEYEELNCSELVWAAYFEAGLDIDSNGGIGVYPNDIYNSNYFEVVEVYY